MARRLSVEIPLLPVQQAFLQATDPFVAIVSSRSCGKSFVAILDSLIHVMKGENVLYMSPTEGSFYKGPWLHLQTLLRKFGLENEFHWNGSLRQGTLFGKILFVGTYQNLDAARGATECGTLMLDEFMLSKPNILATLAPCLRGQDALGNPIEPRIRAVGTPDMRSPWQLMIVEAQKYGIKVLRSKMTENVYMTDKQREVMANAIFDPNLRKQEIEGEIILDAGATSIIKLDDFPRAPAYSPSQLVLGGLDMAHAGQRDSHVFSAIRGNTLLAMHEFGICNSEEVAAYIRKFHKRYPLALLNMDLAWSESVFDQLKYEITCRQVAFGAGAPEGQNLAYGNMRGYGYFHLAKMHREGLCVDVTSEFIDDGVVREYKREMFNTHFTLDRIGRLLIEPKDAIKERIGRSPDVADSMMLAALDKDNLESEPTVQAVSNAQMSAQEIDDIMSAFEGI